MARWSSLRAKLKQIKRKFSKVSPFRFFYNRKTDLSKHYPRILCWFLIHDVDRGYNIFPIEFKRKMRLGVGQWRTLFQTAVGDYKPLFEIFTQSILPAINNKSGAQWKFTALIGWTGLNVIRPGKDTDSNKHRHKASKKRNANARSRNRR